MRTLPSRHARRAARRYTWARILPQSTLLAMIQPAKAVTRHHATAY